MSFPPIMSHRRLQGNETILSEAVAVLSHKMKIIEEGAKKLLDIEETDVIVSEGSMKAMDELEMNYNRYYPLFREQMVKDKEQRKQDEEDYVQRMEQRNKERDERQKAKDANPSLELEKKLAHAQKHWKAMVDQYEEMRTQKTLREEGTWMGGPSMHPFSISDEDIKIDQQRADIQRLLDMMRSLEMDLEASQSKSVNEE